MIKTAEELRLSSKRLDSINYEVKDVLGAMQVEMVNANKEGRSSIDFQVPKTYSSVGDNENDIKKIATYVLRELIDNGYRVKIYDIGDGPYLYNISWSIKISKAEKQDLNELLDKHIVKSQK